MIEKKLTTPMVHLTGTPRSALLEGYSHAMESIRLAIEAARATGPNGRYYYPKGPEALGAAIEEHDDRV